MKNLLLLFISLLVYSCQSEKKELPIIGFQETLDDGSIKYHTIPPFSFTNQDSSEVTNETFKNKIYAADFFFTSCPSICPKVMKQMVRIADSQKENDKFMLISHTIDPKRDTEEVLKVYADNLGIDQSKWHFLTGDKDELLDMADDYYVAAYEDPTAPGGFDHSGKILLVDTNGHIRAFCDGTDPDDVSEFIKDIDVLMKEYEE
jgi:protein SCO1/2